MNEGKTWLSFPGLPQVSAILCCTLHLVLQLALFVFFVLGLARIFKPVVARAVGIVAGVLWAKYVTLTFVSYFPLNQTATSVVLIVIILLDIFITKTLCNQGAGGGHEAHP